MIFIVLWRLLKFYLKKKNKKKPKNSQKNSEKNSEKKAKKNSEKKPKDDFHRTEILLTKFSAGFS